MKRKPKNLAVEELLKMLPAFLIFNAVLLLACLIYSFFAELSWRAPLGVLLGNGLCIGNFLLLGFSANKTLQTKNEKRGQVVANASYGLRYIGLFAVYALALIAGIIDIIPAFLPLFIPKLYYTFTYIFDGTKGKNSEKSEDAEKASGKE